MTPDEQLDQWIQGESKCPNDKGECCPDFSCCVPSLRWPVELRQRFKQATAEERDRMLFSSLTALVSLSLTDKELCNKVRVIGRDSGKANMLSNILIVVFVLNGAGKLLPSCISVHRQLVNFNSKLYEEKTSSCYKDQSFVRHS